LVQKNPTCIGNTRCYFNVETFEGNVKGPFNKESLYNICYKLAH